MKKLIQILTLLSLLISFLSACSNANQSDMGDVIYMFESEDIPTLDIHNATDPISFNTLANVMEGLVMQSPTKGEVVEGVAQSWSFDENTLTWTFNLNPNSNWVDFTGTKQRNISASDFVYAWDRLLQGEAFQYAFLLKDVAKVVSYKAIDDLTFSVTLSENVPYFLSIMTFPSTYPLASEIVNNNYGTTPENTWYNGAYYLSEWTHGSQFIWTKNNSYWDASVVRTHAVVWRVIENYNPATGIELYDAGEIDYVPLTGDFVTQRKDDRDAIIQQDTAIYYLMFNIANAGIQNNAPLIDTSAGNDLFDNLKIRQAMALQIDKNYITEQLLKDGSTPAYYFIPNNYLSYNGVAFESERDSGYLLTNKAEAQKLFEEGMQELGYEKGDNHLSIELINYETSIASLIMEYVKQELDPLFSEYGITINIRPLPLSEKLALFETGDFELTFSRWLPDYDWPTTYLDKWLSTNAINLVGYSNAEYDALVSPQGKTADQAYQELQKAESILLNDAAIIPLYQGASIYLQNPAVHDVYYFISGYDSSFKWAYKDIQN